MMNEEERVAHLSGRWATSYGPVGMPASLPSSTTPPVIPANAGIYVPSPVSYARECGVKAHGTSSLPSFRRKPESTSPPRCHMPVSWRRSLTRRPELIRCPSESGLRGFPLSPERRHLCKSNSSPALQLRDDSCILDGASCPDRFAGLPASGELWYTCRRIA